MPRLALTTLLAASLFSQSRSATRPAGTPEYTYAVVNIYPHDRNAFTQGLEYHEGALYEGTGLNGRSSLRKVQLKDGTVERRVDLDPQYFGEGITVVGDEVFQLTLRPQ
jgi:glutaminyl-peptide cyclotransferase